MTAAIPMPTLAAWLPTNTHPQVAVMIRRAVACVGVCEYPLGANRGTEVDAWNLAGGAPVASYWCASFATAMWRDSGLQTAGKGKDPSCDDLMAWAKATKRWSDKSALGALVFYGPKPEPGKPVDAQHVGIIVRTSPAILVVGGNERWGAVASRNGVAVQLRAEERRDILGYAHPFPVTT